MVTPGLIAFDVNETLLSLTPLETELEPIFGPKPPLGEWFARLLHGSLVANSLDRYRPFGEIAADALVSMAGRRGLALHPEEATAVISVMSRLPAHPDVLPGVRRMAAAGVRMVALTNGSREVAKAQISNAGLADYLERVISVEEIGVYKPDPAPYLHTAELMGVPIGEMVLVAAHDWDCVGAMNAGADSVFVRRPGVIWGMPEPPPSRQVADIEELATSLGA